MPPHPSDHSPYWICGIGFPLSPMPIYIAEYIDCQKKQLLNTRILEIMSGSFSMHSIARK